MTEGRLPNFFIVGAPKCGTTSLYHHLRQHPDIYMSPLKETSYFASEFRVENLAPELQKLGRRSSESLRRYLDCPPLAERFGGIVTKWQDYQLLFKQAGKESAVGEATPGYLWSPTAALRIAGAVPDAKIIMILRDPIERAFSQYLQMSNTGLYRMSFDDHVEACLARRGDGHISMVHPFLEYGLYSEQVQRYRDAFPLSRIGIWLYEETLAPGFLRSVYEFLGVSGDFVPDTSKRYLEQRVPRIPYLSRLLARPVAASVLRLLVPDLIRPVMRRIGYRRRRDISMSDGARRRMMTYYRADVELLAGMLGRDLSSWLDGRRR